MKAAFALCAAAALVAGCAADPATQVAQRTCKIAPITTTSVTGKARPMTPIEQREAEMNLARTQFRFQNLQRNGPDPNLVEEAIRDCN